MKQKSIFIALLAGMLSLSACSDDDPVNGNVPAKVQSEFQARFPGVSDVQWDKVQGYHVARFNGRSRAAAYENNAWFTDQGMFCQHDIDVEYDELPMVVRTAFEKYKEKWYPAPEYKVDDCELIAREGMDKIYVIEIESKKEERQISVSMNGDILKDVLDDDDDDDILPIIIPDALKDALKKEFPDTYKDIAILEYEADDDEIEVDIIESNRHKEVEFDINYNLKSIEYKVSLKEAEALMGEVLYTDFVNKAKEYGYDVTSEEVQQAMKIEYEKNNKGQKFEIEIEMNDQELEIEIDENGKFEIKLD